MKSEYNRTAVIRELWTRLKGYRSFLILSILMAAASVAGTLLVPVLVGRAIDVIAGKGEVDFPALFILIRQGILVALLTGLAQWIMNLCNNKISYHMTRDLRNEAIRTIEKLPVSFIDSHSHGDLVSRMITDVDQVADGLLMGFSQFFTGLITILATVGFIFSIHAGIAALIVFLTPISLFVARFIANRTYSMFTLQSKTRGEETALIEEMIDGQKVVRAFAYEDKAIARFEEIDDRLCAYSLRAIFFSSITNPSTRFVNSLVYAAVALTGAWTVISGGLTVGSLTCLLAYANQYTKPFNEISGVITELTNALTCAGRILELIGEKTETADRQDALELETGSHEITFSDVDFSYLPQRPLIRDLNLNVRAGQRIAIVGPTGSGKTTLINLLMRFYDVNAGSLSIDGHDIRDITRASLRENFGMVLQDTWIRSGTIRDNITMGREGFTEEEIIDAAVCSHAYDFIRKMPKGLDTEISEENTVMSQGQKQLLCITRVMLLLPPMLILDEATSSIDTRTELLIQQAFETMMKGRTSFIVAHRLSTIEGADCILVMKDGSIIEQGNHRELLAANGFYADLYRSQFQL